MYLSKIYERTDNQTMILIYIVSSQESFCLVGFYSNIPFRYGFEASITVIYGFRRDKLVMYHELKAFFLAAHLAESQVMQIYTLGSSLTHYLPHLLPPLLTPAEG